ncbi:unnamed protein product [Urochloa humidicola]
MIRKPQETDADSGTAKRGSNPDDATKWGAKSNKKGDDGAKIYSGKTASRK